jgi:hypothetical protein
MLHSLKLGRPLLAAAAIFWGVAFGTPANANSILITPDSGAVDNDLVTIISAGSFVGLLGTDGSSTATNGAAFLAGTGSFTDAFGFLTEPGVSDAEALTTACNCGPTFTETGKDDDAQSSYVIPSEFFSIKQDGWIAFFHNLTGGPITVSLFEGDCGPFCVGADPKVVSHAAFLVPFPAVGAGLPGLVMACGGLLMLARRRRQQIA